MASRDLTSAFTERRAAANLRRRSSTDKTGNHGGGRAMAPFGISTGSGRQGGDDHLLMEEGIPSSPARESGSSIPPLWVDDVDAIHSLLAEISRLMGLLHSMHATRLGSVFGKDLDDMESKIEHLTRDVTDLFRQAERLLKRVGSATKRAGGEEATVGANVQRSLAKRLQELSVQFRQKQRKYLTDVQMQKGGGFVAESNQKFGIDLNDNPTPDNLGFTPQQLAVVDDLQSAVQSRDGEIQNIAKSIEELGSIFKELAVLVIDQGTILDRIDYNMEAVVEHTREGITQLEKAETHQKSARPMKCIMCLLSVIAILTFILIIKHKRRWH